MQCSLPSSVLQCSLAARPCRALSSTRPVMAGMRMLQQQGGRLRRRAALEVVATYPEPETEKERSPIDFPQEWITPQPSRRPDIFPEFEKLQTPLPKPMPGDPEMPDEEEEEEKEKKPDKEDPDEDKPKPDEPAPSEE
ncbi:hypothetical protein ABPG77_003328 [Micractinium sp. CCAP 211/92]